MPPVKLRSNLTVDERLGYLDADFQQSELLGVIVNALKDRSPRVRGRDVQLAIDSVIREARPHITEALRDRSEQIRMDAAECSGVFDRWLGEANRELQCLLEDRAGCYRTNRLCQPPSDASPGGAAMIESMATVRITEAELARDVRAVLEKVEQGNEVIIEREDHRPLAVISSPQRSGRPMADILREAAQRNSKVRLDEDFGRDLEGIIASHQHPWKPPSWD